MLNNAMAKQDGLAEAWLDLDTYKLSSIPDQIMTLQNLSPSDLQRTARQLFETGMMASVAVGNAELVKNLLERETQVELLGASKPDIKQPETAPATKPSSRPD
jgi:hypothetical protein